jgi:predicted peptidase
MNLHNRLARQGARFMNKITHFLMMLAAATAVCAADAPEPRPDGVQSAKSFKARITRTVSTDYLLFLPKAYKAAGKMEWPLIYFLHGAGERGINVWRTGIHGPPKVVREQPDFPFIVVSPQCAPGQRWDNDTLLALLDEIIHKYRVDTRRVYLTGLSMGGYGTWSLGLAHPERFAAIAPVCGGGDQITVLLPDPKKIAALKSLGIWAFHGAKDPVVEVGESERMVKALRKAGCTDIELTIYPEAGHNAWAETYANPKLYDWFLQHRRP